MTQNRSEQYLYAHEMEAWDKRRKIAEALENGWTYKRIQEELKVAPSTISAVKKMTKGDLR